MTFYEQLSRYYDEVFPAGEAEMHFVRDMLAGCERILDIGCGTGNKTEILSEGARAVAFDADPGMIAAARRRHAAPNIRYLVLDMLEMNKAFAAGDFDAALCLGNTLAHLNREKDLPAFLGQAWGVLTEDGVFIAQILNYDRIVRQHITELPPLETANVRFERRYDWRDDNMHFVTDLDVKRDGEVFRNDIVLRPILKHELDDALTAAGFRRIEHYGSYAGTPYDADSFHLIVRAYASEE